MSAYKSYSGNPCKMKMCDCTCNPADGSITIAKLATETIEWVMDQGDINKYPAVDPILYVTWYNHRTKESFQDESILAEKGDTFDWTGQYTWYSEEGFSNPYKIESNVFDTFVSEGELSDAKTETVSNDTDFTIKMYAVNGAASTTSSSIRFCEPFYYGIKDGKLNKILSETIDNSINVNTAENEYFVYKYPTSLPKLKYIHMDDALNVIQAFNYSEEDFVTDTGLNVKLRVYTSANPGAFTNVKLSFK